MEVNEMKIEILNTLANEKRRSEQGMPVALAVCARLCVSDTAQAENENGVSHDE